VGGFYTPANNLAENGHILACWIAREWGLGLKRKPDDRATELAIIKGILEDDPMKRWQDPPIETRADAPRPYYFIRP
jgi:hypothetical protein